MTIFSDLITRCTREDRGYESPCLIFTGQPSQKYGKIAGVTTHTIAWESVYGRTPPGSHLHHRCRQTRCCNPTHLTPLTPSEHKSAHRPTYCTNGHEFTPENTRPGTVRGRYPVRHCRACNREKTRRYRERPR